MHYNVFILFQIKYNILVLILYYIQEMHLLETYRRVYIKILIGKINVSLVLYSLSFTNDKKNVSKGLGAQLDSYSLQIILLLSNQIRSINKIIG